MRLVTGDEMRRIEDDAVHLGVDTLIQNAGGAVARKALRYARAGIVLVLVGPGNNGSDGLVAAEAIRRAHRSVHLYSFRRDVGERFRDIVTNSEDDHERRVLQQLLERAGLVVDALLGTGQNRPLSSELVSIVSEVNGSRKLRVLAVDVPTGVSADTGVVLNDAVHSDLTLSMGFAKCGLYQYPGATYAGEVEVADVGLPSAPEFLPRTILADELMVASLLPQRSANGSKGSSGTALFVGGSRDFCGAPSMASMAAYRAGAGLLRIGVPRSILPVVAGHATEPVYLPLAERDGRIASSACPDIADALKKAKALIFGPGMGLSEETIELTRDVLEVLRSAPVSTVIDADGLNALSRIDSWWKGRGKIVVTPHPGEMARLTGLSIDEIQSNRIELARQKAAEWGVVVVLKGAGTVVATPDGFVSVNPTGGPNLATAGTGDVLSGIIGGLLAQGCTTRAAAVAGVFIHGRAGDMLRATQGEAGTVAGDLLEQVPTARNTIVSRSKVNI